MNMANCFVIVADGARARMFVLEKDEALQAGSRLVEKIDLVNTDYTARGPDAPRVRSERNTSRQAGPVHPQDAERDRHRIELERRFAREIAAHASAMVKAGSAGKVILVAEPRMLGLLRRPLRAATGKRVSISEIARNHTHLTPSRLHQRLTADALIW
jgi:protein required for attachment to host cells